MQRELRQTKTRQRGHWRVPLLVGKITLLPTHVFNLSVIGRNYNIRSKKVLGSFYGDVSPDVESRCV